MSDDDIRKVIRDFKSSVSADVEAMHRRLDTFTGEVRERLRLTDELIRSVETGFHNELREVAQRVDRRADGVDNRLDGIDNRLDGIDNRLDGIDGRLDGIEGQLATIIDRLPPAA